MRIFGRLLEECGATATETMLAISVVVIGTAAAGYTFVPGFNAGVNNLSNDVSVILAGGMIGEVGYNGTSNGTTGGSGGDNTGNVGATVVTNPSAPAPAPYNPYGRFGFGSSGYFGYGGLGYGGYGFYYNPFAFTGFSNYGLGYQMLFGARFFSSGYQPGRSVHHYQNICGAYALSSALASLLGQNMSAQQVVQKGINDHLNIFDNTGRVTADGLATLARDLGLCPQTHAGFDSNKTEVTSCSDDLALVQSQIDAGRVPVMLINVDDNGNAAYGRQAEGSGHYVIPVSVGEDEVIVKDPVTGETRSYPRADMCGAWGRQGREMVTLSAPSGNACTT